MLALILIGVPLYLAILSCAAIIMTLSLHIDTYQPLAVMFTRVADYNMLAIPLFVFLGSILSMGGAGKALIKLFNTFLGHIPGGPAYGLVFASVLVAAMCAHPMAAIAGFGPLIVPMLIQLGYSEAFSIGLLLASASLAPLIPPNTIAIIYTVIANPVITPNVINVTTFWTAAIVPGLVLAAMLCATIFVYCRFGKQTQTLTKSNWADRWAALKDSWPIVLAPVAILGPLYANWANPTEVAALGCIYILVISRFFYKGTTWKTMWAASVSTLRVLGAIFLIIMASLLLTNVIVRAHVPQDITSWISNMGLNWWMFMAAMVVVYFLMGMFLDPSAIVLITVPMLLPATVTLGLNPYAFGVFTCIAVVLAGVTPPYGLTIFATQSILSKPYATVAKGCVMFVPTLTLGMILVGYIPALSTWLPTLLGKM